MTNWNALTNELDRWAGDGPGATLWWRDDDAAPPSPALDRLLTLRAHAGAPLALAVVAATVEERTADRIEADDGADVLQHGYAHRNHAPAGEPKAEFGPQRPMGVALDELAAGRRRLESMFGQRLLKVLVPPWNRIADDLVGRLGTAGFDGLSAYGPRSRARPAPGLRQVNTHIDIIDWRSTRGFIGEDAALTLAIDHLRARRTGAADRDEPTGLLSHHLAHDEAAWDFVGAFLAATAAHPGARWVSARAAFMAGP